MLVHAIYVLARRLTEAGKADEWLKTDIQSALEISCVTAYLKLAFVMGRFVCRAQRVDNSS